MSDTRSWRAAVSGWFLVLLCAPPIWAWQVRVARSRDVHPIVLDRVGAVVAALDVPPHPLHAGGTALALVKLDRSGGVRWRRRLRAHGRERRDFIYALQTTSDDDVLTAGSLYDNGLSTFFVARLAGRDGAVLWQGDVHGERRQPGDEAAALALGPDGDLVVAGGLEGASSPPNHFALDFAVVKLSADRGEERWRCLLDGSAEDFDDASAVALVPPGDVAAVGDTSDADGRPALMAALLDAGTGSERWHRFLRGNDGYGYGDGLAVLPDGDVVVEGQFRNRHTCYDLSFARLSAASGEVRELRSLDGTTTVPLCDSDCEHGVCRTPPRSGLDRDRLSALTVDAEGRIVVAGVVCDGYHGRNRGLVAAISSKRDGMP